MFCVNFGTLTAKEHFSDVQREMIDAYLDTVEVTENTIIIEELYGDIEEALFSMINDLSASGASISGMISYYGDHEGTYVFMNNLGKTLTQEERALYEISIEDLLDFVSIFYPAILPFHLLPNCDIQRLSYALYVNDWKSRHPINPEETNQSLRKIYKTNKKADGRLQKCPAPEVIYTPYKSFINFLGTDYQDAEYMCTLLQEEGLISEYLTDKNSSYKL